MDPKKMFQLDDMMTAIDLRQKAQEAYDKEADKRTAEEAKLAKWWEYHLLSLMGVAFTI